MRLQSFGPIFYDKQEAKEMIWLEKTEKERVYIRISEPVKEERN